MYKKSGFLTGCINMFSGISAVNRLLIFSCGFSFALTLARIIFTGTWMFTWLNWNLFLAFVPYYISSWIIRKPWLIDQKIKFTALFIAWLVFIPNSFYLITDIFHFELRRPVPLWFDLALIISFVWNGIFLGVLSIHQMERIIQVKFNLKNNWFFVLAVMWLNAFGVYVGRYLRYNSWDIVTNPLDLFNDIIYLFIHPIRNRYDWSMVMCYAVLMTVIYLGFNVQRKMEID
jgi:uncharacterized membrane protein